ncbi:MAG TPA: Ig-like domain-containing protein [Vicinamibacteria bacterium]
MTVTSPTAGSTVGGTIPVNATVSIIGVLTVQRVQFQLDGANLGAADETAPYSVSWNTFPASNGTHTLRAVAQDMLGVWWPSQPVTVTVFNDHTPPTVAITAPAAGATVSGVVAVSANASDNVGVVGVQFQVDGANLGAEDTVSPYSVTWNTATVADGSHSLRAIGRDAAGNSTISSAVTVTVMNDTTPPTVSITSPSSGATVGGVITVTANASDNVGVVGVQFRVDGANLGAEDTSAPYSVSWDTGTATPGTHSLTAIARDAVNNTATSTAVSVTVLSSGAGDVFVAITDGSVQWHNPDGTLKQMLPAFSDGQASSVSFDAAGNVYVPHWWNHAFGTPGNTVARYDLSGALLGAFGSGYNSDPSSLAFDAQGNMYVGQADDTGDILKIDPAGNLVASFDAAVGARGTDHIDLGTDGCTMFYASRTQDVLRFNVCTNTQLPNFNTQPLPGFAAYHVRALPDGGVLVADTQVIVRLDASGNQIQLYSAPGEQNYWGGVDITGDGTFWASNAATDNIYKFDLQSGAILASFNAGPGGTAAGLGVRPIRH